MMMTLLKMSKLLGHDYDSVGFVCWLFSVAAAVAVEGDSVETRKRKSLRSFEKSAAAVAGDVAIAAAVVAGIFAAAKGLGFSVVVGSTKQL